MTNGFKEDYNANTGVLSLNVDACSMLEQMYKIK
jgi:hypothetical protein